jgi:hypothetical protein
MTKVELIAVIENNRASSPRDKDLVGLLNTGLGTA